MAARETGFGAVESYMHQGKLLALDLLVRVLTNPMHDWSHMRPEFAGEGSGCGGAGGGGWFVMRGQQAVGVKSHAEGGKEMGREAAVALFKSREMSLVVEQQGVRTALGELLVARLQHPPPARPPRPRPQPSCATRCASCCCATARRPTTRRSQRRCACSRQSCRRRCVEGRFSAAAQWLGGS